MKKYVAALLLVTATAMATPLSTVAAASAAVADETISTYAIVDRFAGGDGSYDYISFDPDRQQVFVGRKTGVMKIDLASRRVTMDFVKGEDVAAVLPIPGTSLMLSTNGEADRATLFDRNTGDIKAQIPTGKGPDGALYDPSSGVAFVMNGESHDVNFIDVGQASVLATVPLGGEPEAAATDGTGHLYVNIKDTAEIAVVDMKARKLITRYRLAACERPTGMDYDARTGLLISACHNNVAKLIDASTGADRGTVKIGQDADGAIFDAARRLVFIPCNDGRLSIFHIDANGKAGPVTNVATQRFARTAALDQRTGRLFLPVNKRVKAADDDWTAIPGSFEVLVVAPRRQARHR